MNIHSVLAAIEYVDEAIATTPEVKKRDELDRARFHLTKFLQEHGVFVYVSSVPTPPCHTP